MTYYRSTDITCFHHRHVELCKSKSHDVVIYSCAPEELRHSGTLLGSTRALAEDEGCHEQQQTEDQGQEDQTDHTCKKCTDKVFATLTDSHAMKSTHSSPS